MTTIMYKTFLNGDVKTGKVLGYDNYKYSILDEDGLVQSIDEMCQAFEYKVEKHAEFTLLISPKGGGVKIQHGDIESKKTVIRNIMHYVVNSYKKVFLTKNEAILLFNNL